MGIPGLTTYINNRSDRYLEPYELHDSYLVIDGNSVGCQIYSSYAKCNCAFGGDYDKYANSISNFFDDLLKCNVTPLVLIDGGCEDKKLKTLINRNKDKLRAGLSFCPSSQQRTKFFPLIRSEVFIQVLREKNIRYVRCLFEADNTIAAVAKILDCPVLSFDSDFYIYGSMYIPFNTLDMHIMKSTTGNGYMKRCLIYRVEKLLYSFRGLDKSLLPLAAILLGNDYVKRSTFKNIFSNMRVQGNKRGKFSRQLCCIDATFRWLSGYTLDKALIAILSRIPKQRRQAVLDIIEVNINGYTNIICAEILVPLGFPQDHVAHLNTYSINRNFKFDGDINNLTYIEETCVQGDSEASEGDEEEDDVAEVINNFQESDVACNNMVISKLPLWFINDFKMGHFPSYFMDLKRRKLYMCQPQIEDPFYPHTHIASIKIISVICGLLISERDNKRKYLNYMARGQNQRLQRFQIDIDNTLFSCKLPSLYNLREIPLIIRRRILTETLGITDEDCINELPPEWMLYIACAKYWMEQRHNAFHKSHCYIYSLLFCMLFNIVDSKIGRHRAKHIFHMKYRQTIEMILKKRKTLNNKAQYSSNVTIIQAYNEIDAEDCMLAAPFFVSHFEMNQELCSNPKKFNRTIVHVFAEFQSCLRHSMHLNALLGYPYPEPQIAKLFNGTLLYNLYDNFKMRTDVEVYINTVFQHSQSLLRLFNVVLLRVKSMFRPLACRVTNANLDKRQRKRVKSVETVKNDSEHNTIKPDPSDDLSEVPFFDASNPFSLLGSM